MSSGASPTVSVVIPTYNRETVLPRALDSVLAQTYGDFEVIVVDDGSRDGTAGVMAEYVRRDGRVRYCRQSQNAGVSAARNRGIREAKGEFVAFLDSDDEWAPTKLERQIERFREANSEVGLVYCGVETVYGDGGGWTFVPEHRGDVYRDLLLKNVIHTGSGAMVRRSVTQAVGYFNEEIPAIEDYEYWLRISRHYQFDYVQEALVRYHDTRTTDRKSLNLDDNLEAREWFFREHGADQRKAGVAHLFLLSSARRHLRSGRVDKRVVRRLAVRAALIRPHSREVHLFLARHVWPRKLYRTVQTVRRVLVTLVGSES